MNMQDPPLIGRLTELEPKRTALLLKIMERPAIFFGRMRFDYMMCFLDGYDFHEHEHHPKGFMRECGELEHWLLHTQSATLHGSLNGWSLFYRCFGCGEEAFGAYREFLHTSLPQDEDSVWSVWYELFKYESAHEIPFHIGYRITSEKHKQMAQTVLDNITEMLRRSGIAYDQLKVYVRRDTYFLQVRFLYRGEGGWTDDRSLIAKPENHGLLLAIHAYALSASIKALQDCGCDVIDTRRRERRSDEDIARHDWPYSLSFASDYEKWKSEFLTHLLST